MKRIAVLLVLIALLVSAVPARADSICKPGEIEIGGMCFQGPTVCARGESETANGCIARPPVCCVVAAYRHVHTRITYRPMGSRLLWATKVVWR